MKPTSPPTLLEGAAFIKDFIKKVEASRRHIAIVVTTFHNDCESMHYLIEALENASKRGVKVSVYADAYTYVEPREFIIRSPKKQPIRAYKALRLERRLRSHGITFHWLGKHGNFGFAGRTHAKWMIVDDYVYSFGGINLDFGGLENTDYLIRYRFETMSEDMLREHQRLYKADRGGHASKSHRIAVDKESCILVDGGLPGDSIIYRHAVRLAREAVDITLVSQYSPTGKLAKILRKKNTVMYFNHWRHAPSLNKGLIGIGMFMSRSATAYGRDNYLHAKFILFTMPDGHKIALTGSHNFMFSSVLVGTREIALQTEDSAIIKSLEAFARKRII